MLKIRQPRDRLIFILRQGPGGFRNTAYPSNAHLKFKSLRIPLFFQLANHSGQNFKITWQLKCMLWTNDISWYMRFLITYTSCYWGVVLEKFTSLFKAFDYKPHTRYLRFVIIGRLSLNLKNERVWVGYNNFLEDTSTSILQLYCNNSVQNKGVVITIY